jgi:AcrR family transcriptional regulator
VTTRRLADRIEYSQPALYSHFEGKDAIVSAVPRGVWGAGRATAQREQEGPFAYCKAASGRQHLHQGVKIRLPLTRLTYGAKDLRRHSQPPVHSIKRGRERYSGWRVGT